MLADAESQVANIRVRGQGTIGGNLCFNDPHSDPATALLIYDASVTLQGPNGARANARCCEFLRGMYATALEPDELLVWIDVPCFPAEFGSSYLRIHRLQRPTLTVAAAAARRNGAIGDVRLAVGCVGSTALRLTLERKPAPAHPNDSGKIIGEAKAYLKKALEPIDDLLGSAEYKIYIAGVLLERALAQALQSVDKKQDGKNG